MMQSSHTFRCHQCGGSAVPVAGRDYMQCEYCQSFVFDAENPLNVDRIITNGDHIEADCPGCHRELKTGTVEDHRVLYCGSCYGMLIRHSDFGAVVRKRRSQRAPEDMVVPEPIDKSQFDRSIDCPNCRREMEVHPYYGPGNVVIDTCSACQYIWLDHSELSRVERSTGGSEPGPIPLHVNEHGDVTIIPPPEVSMKADGWTKPMSIFDILFGFD